MPPLLEAVLGDESLAIGAGEAALDRGHPRRLGAIIQKQVRDILPARKERDLKCCKPVFVLCLQVCAAFNNGLQKSDIQCYALWNLAETQKFLFREVNVTLKALEFCVMHHQCTTSDLESNLNNHRVSNPEQHTKCDASAISPAECPMAGTCSVPGAQ